MRARPRSGPQSTDSMASSSTTGRAAAGEASPACCKVMLAGFAGFAVEYTYLILLLLVLQSICAEVCTDFGNNFGEIWTPLVFMFGYLINTSVNS